jgi:hypothetical protein
MIYKDNFTITINVTVMPFLLGKKPMGLFSEQNIFFGNKSIGKIDF